MLYLLGLTTGVVIAILILLATMRFRVPIERTINRALSMTKQKGEIFEPDDNEIKDWLDKLPKE